nr:Chain C, ILE-LEU-ALA-PRO-PRO-GLU-ARG [Crassostrea gigas]7XNM_D Chain D, ILE-LEU-ALA-PRO-PRO-GLU-ARG [Crassostrea gigas]
ILAPPER